MKIINNHIPRTIFGVKYDRDNQDGSKDFNVCERFDTKGEQLRRIEHLKVHPDLYSDIKELKWLIKP